jgi:hypothetical protein
MSHKRKDPAAMPKTTRSPTNVDFHAHEAKKNMNAVDTTIIAGSRPQTKALGGTFSRVVSDAGKAS